MAEHAQVGLRTVFRHFEDLDSIYREMAEQMMEMINAQGEVGPEEASSADEMTEAVVDLMKELSPEQLGRFTGPTVWKFSSDDLGWVYRQWFLAPVNVGG